MPRKPKPFLHQGHYYTTVGGTWRKLCTEAEGFDAAVAALAALTAKSATASPVALNSPSLTTGPALSEAIAKYQKHCETYYRLPSGKLSGEVRSIPLALRFLARTAGEGARTAGLSRDVLKSARESMILTCSRKTVNQHIGRIKRAVKWWVEEKLIPDAVANSLLLLSPLPAFRSAARETEPVGAVEWEIVQATVEQLVEPWRSLVQYQWWTGQRPGEACGLLVEWVTLTEDGGRVDFGLNHKTGWRGTEKTLPIGPQAANVLRPWMESAKLRSREFVFATTWTARGAEPRRTIPPSYARAVLRACKAAKVEPWHPNQLRHSFATRVRAALGLEAAQHALGHARADVTQIYAEKNQATAAEVARRLG